MPKRFLIVLGVLSIALMSGCNAGVYYQADTDVVLDPSEAVTINGTLTYPGATGASADISKSRSIGVTKALEGSECIARLADGTELGRGGVDDSGAFTILFDPAIVWQDVYGKVFVGCNVTVNGTPFNASLYKYLSGVDYGRGDSKDIGVDLNTTLALYDQANPSNPDELMAIAGSSAGDMQYQFAMGLAELVDQKQGEDIGLIGVEEAWKARVDFFSDLLTNLLTNLANEDILDLNRLETSAERLEAVWTNVTSDSLDRDSIQSVLQHIMYFSHVTNNFLIDDSTRELILADDTRATAAMRYLSSLDHHTAQALYDNRDSKMEPFREMFKQVTAVAANSVDPILAYVTCEAMHITTVLCDALNDFAFYDVMGAYFRGMDEQAIRPPEGEPRGVWLGDFGNSSCNVARFITEDNKDTYILVMDEAASLIGDNPSATASERIGRGIVEARLEAMVEGLKSAGGANPFENATACNADASCLNGTTCSPVHMVCTPTSCQSQSGSCTSGFGCTYDSQCVTNNCKFVSWDNVKGSCAKCVADSECDSGSCLSDGHCTVPQQQQQQQQQQEPEPAPPLPVLSAVWNRTTSNPSSVTGCPAQITANNLTIQGNSPNFSFAALPAFTISWDGLGQACTAKACATCANCATCSVTPNGTWNVLAFTNCDLPNPGIQDCDGSYAKQP